MNCNTSVFRLLTDRCVVTVAYTGHFTELHIGFVSLCTVILQCFRLATLPLLLVSLLMFAARWSVSLVIIRFSLAVVICAYLIHKGLFSTFARLRVTGTLRLHWLSAFLVLHWETYVEVLVLLYSTGVLNKQTLKYFTGGVRWRLSVPLGVLVAAYV